MSSDIVASVTRFAVSASQSAGRSLLRIASSKSSNVTANLHLAISAWECSGCHELLAAIGNFVFVCVIVKIDWKKYHLFLFHPGYDLVEVGAETVMLSRHQHQNDDSHLLSRDDLCLMLALFFDPSQMITYYRSKSS